MYKKIKNVIQDIFICFAAILVILFAWAFEYAIFALVYWFLYCFIAGLTFNAITPLILLIIYEILSVSIHAIRKRKENE